MADEDNAYSFTTQARQQFSLENLPADGFRMWRGGHLSEVTIAFESWGELSPAADNAILIFTGLSPSAHAASCEVDSSPGWWEYMSTGCAAVTCGGRFVDGWHGFDSLCDAVSR